MLVPVACSSRFADIHRFPSQPPPSVHTTTTSTIIITRTNTQPPRNHHHPTTTGATTQLPPQPPHGIWGACHQHHLQAYPSPPSPLQSVPPLSQPPPVHHFTSRPSPQQQLNLSTPTPSIFFNNVELVQISTVLFSLRFMTNF